jgi:uncharacterized repeat protein (TIGR01451 family)
MKKKLIATTLILAALMLNVQSQLGVMNWFSTPAAAKAQTPGKDGEFTVTSQNTIVNKYARLATDVAAGATALTIANPGGPDGLDAGALGPDDLLLLIQMAGATIDTSDTVEYGKIVELNNAGRYEFVYVGSVSGNVVTLNTRCGGLKYSYTAAGKVQVIKVPQYTALTINAGASLTAPAWNGAIGGIVVVDVQSAAVINGSVDVSGRGLRGGALSGPGNGGLRLDYRTTDGEMGAEKGEGIAGYQIDYDSIGGRYARGAAANGGGGGTAHNCGGGGGANGANGKVWNGQGVMDGAVTGAAAWALDPGYVLNGNAITDSSGGGRGGYSFAYRNADALTEGPGNPAWQGDFRREVGGLGGHPIAQDVAGRLFLGGGGGAGAQNNEAGGGGGNAGGLIFLKAQSISGTGLIRSNGAPGQDTRDTHRDAAGGGGAGGTIVVAAQTLSGLTAEANGGSGGNQIRLVEPYLEESHGPGGGGGGGFIAYSGGVLATQVLGGVNGISSSFSATEFPPNGATRGASGAAVNSIPSIPICPPPNPQTDISIVKKASVETVAPGGTLTYTLVATNLGTLAASGVTVNDPLPAGLTYVSATTSKGSCSGTQTVSCTIGALAAGEAATVTVQAKVSDTFTPGAVSNTGTVTSTTPDSNPGNNSSTVVVTVVLKPGPRFTPGGTKIGVEPVEKCFGAGGIVNVQIELTNTGSGEQRDNAGPELAATLPAQLTAIAGSCTSTTGTCSAQGDKLEWNGAVAAGAKVTISYQVQIQAGTAVGTAICTDYVVSYDSDSNLSNDTSFTVNNCFTTNCRPMPCRGNNCPGDGDPGHPIPETPGDTGGVDRPGSILIYPIYTSKPCNYDGQDKRSNLSNTTETCGPDYQDTRISIANTHTSQTAYVHLFFIDGGSCSVSDSFLCLTPNQTSSFLMSELDPGVTGYIIAVAVDKEGRPIKFNRLIGSEYVKFPTGHHANLAAEAVLALTSIETPANAQETTIKLDGKQYSMLGATVAVDNLPSKEDGNSTMLVLERIGGNLSRSATQVGAIGGVLFNDTEIGSSFSSDQSKCQLRTVLGHEFPRTSPGYTQVIPSHRSGWMKIFPSDRQGRGGFVGASINANPNQSGFTGGHNLHKLTLGPTSLIIPITPPDC